MRLFHRRTQVHGTSNYYASRWKILIRQLCSKKLRGAVIAAIAIGATVLVGLIAASTICFLRSRKTALQRDDRYHLSSDTIHDVSKAETGDILAGIPYVDMKGGNNMLQQAENIKSSRGKF